MSTLSAIRHFVRFIAVCYALAVVQLSMCLVTVREDEDNNGQGWVV